MYRTLFAPFYYLMNLYVHKNNDFYFENIHLGKDLTEDKKNEIEEFRRIQFEKDQSYLIPKTYIEKLKERRIDSYSYQFIVRSKLDNTIVASMRLTPWPFEYSSYVSEENLNDFKNFLEISRLIVKVKGVGIGKKLLIYAGIFAISKTKYHGFVAICKEERLGMFNSFGLLSKRTFKIPHRGNANYHLISSSFFLISGSAMIRFVRPKQVLKV